MVLKEYERSTKRYINDRNDEEEHGWIGLGYHFRTCRETSNCGSTTALDVTKLSRLLVGYSDRLLKQAHSSSDWRTLYPIGHSAILDTELGCLWSGSILVDGRSAEFMETLVGSRT